MAQPSAKSPSLSKRSWVLSMNGGRSDNPVNITSPLGIGSQPPLDGATRRTSGFDPDATHSDPNPRVTGLGSKHSLPRHSMSVIGLPPH